MNGLHAEYAGRSASKAFRRTRRYSFRQAQAAAEKRAEQEEQEKLALRRRMSKGHTPKYTATKRRRGL